MIFETYEFIYENGREMDIYQVMDMYGMTEQEVRREFKVGTNFVQNSYLDKCAEEAEDRYYRM